MTYDFIINTENVNEYGYRILTDGIDYEQYMRNPVVLFIHEREYQKSGKEKGSAVIGRCIKLYKKGTDLVASIEFDEADEFAQKIAGKVARGFIRMASMYGDVKESSMDVELLLPGQTYETVTKCKLVEISIVDIGGNDDALKLSKSKVDTLKLKKITNTVDMNLKTIALALNIPADSTEDVILKEVQELRLAKTNAETRATNAETQLKGIQEQEATQLVDKAIVLGLIPEALKTVQLGAFTSDFDGQKAVLSKLILEKETSEGQQEVNQKIKEVVLNGKPNQASNTQETFDYLQKFDSIKLAKIQQETPEVYKSLVADYAKGVRHKK
ncbi:hypothetical protein FLACOL_01075 [Flavobacterium columnare]|uniref:Prohead serine protease n=2 Tax=Flavobacterium TaxID=237 RepID=A0ABW8PMB3_9FLAO|nr:hypothetical protein [Flavobacterium columnare]SPE77085.1 hypothetical protein FLACOL_01075 [Flavobacterium columnare]